MSLVDLGGRAETAPKQPVTAGPEHQPRTFNRSFFPSARARERRKAGLQAMCEMSVHVNLALGNYDRAFQMLLRTAVLFLLFFGTPVHAQNKALLLFGGDGHKTFLGCINCGKYESGSVCNQYGEYGSKYSNSSIWNKYGDFGGKYSDESPFNRYASNPPVIVDRDGGFYGYLTANKYNSKRTQIKALLALTDLSEEIADDPESISDRLCGQD